MSLAFSRSSRNSSTDCCGLLSSNTPEDEGDDDSGGAAEIAPAGSAASVFSTVWTAVTRFRGLGFLPMGYEIEVRGSASLLTLYNLFQHSCKRKFCTLCRDTGMRVRPSET